VRHPVAHEVAAAFRNDRQPALRIFLKGLPFEGIELVADEYGNWHGLPPERDRSNPESLTLRRIFSGAYWAESAVIASAEPEGLLDGSALGGPIS
jgi:hypothetical protein